MKRIIAQLGIIVFVISLLWIYNVSAATVNVTFPYSDVQVQAAIDAETTVTGDIVYIPACAATWNASVTIPSNKKITLMGAGFTNTVITRAGHLLDLNESGSGSRVTGLGFILTSDAIAVDVKGTGWRIDHCKFDNISGSFITAIQPDGANASVHPVGLIDNCEFINGKVDIIGRGNFTTQSESWAEPLNLGSSVAVYIEDCTFSKSIVSVNNCVDTNYAGRYVFRFNTVTQHHLEAHSLQGNHRATIKWEIYGNTQTATSGYVWPISVRGGTGVIFNNNFYGPWTIKIIRIDNRRSVASLGSGGLCNGGSSWDGNEAVADGSGAATANDATGTTLTDSGASWTIDELIGYYVYNITDGSKGEITDNDRTTVSATLSGGTNNDWEVGDEHKITNGYPCRDQIGRSDDEWSWTDANPYSGQTLAPAYEWNNIYDDTDNIDFSVSRGSEKHIVENRDYYNSNASFDGTSGVGVGTLASRPATCTVGVAYWATDQGGDWNTINGTANDGCLYKCTAPNTWEKYYEPYTYPHPLRQAGAGGKPLSPKDFRIVASQEDFSLSVTTSGNGSVDVVPNQGTYSFGQQVTLTAMADPGWVFSVWSGDLTGNDNPVTLTISGDHQVTATFADSALAYSEGFEAYNDGDDPVDWLDTAANNNMSEDNSLFQVVDIGGEKVFGTASTLRNIHSHYTGSGSTVFSDYEYIGRMMMTASSGGIGVTFLSQYPVRDAYYRLRRYSSNSFHIAPHGASVFGITDTGVVPIANNWYRFRVRVQDTGIRMEILAKVWLDGDVEPIDWQVNAYDDTDNRLTSGTFGVWSSLIGSKYWDDLMVIPFSP